VIELRPNRSPRIANLETAGTSELFEAIAGIERLAAELAVERATDRDLQCLHALQTRVEGFHPDGKLDDYFANARQTLRRSVSYPSFRRALAAEVIASNPYNSFWLWYGFYAPLNGQAVFCRQFARMGRRSDALFVPASLATFSPDGRAIVERRS
jgi:hypothetical protein